MAKPNSDEAERKFATFFDKPPVRVSYGLLGLILAYVFASWAIDSGSLLDYAIAILLIIFGLRELIIGIRTWRKQ